MESVGVGDSAELRAYLAHLRARWAVAALIIGAALAASIVFSYFQAPRYTAAVSLVIEPPANSDPRAATAVSPIYLESLRTYEHFASSDQLFAQAAKKFGLRTADDSRPLESLKKSILEVSIPRNTKILKIEVTLSDAGRAHALATHLAAETIELSRRTGQDADQELIERARRQATLAEEAAKDAHAALQRAMKRSPAPDALRAEMERLRERSTEVERLALAADLTEGDLEDRTESVPPSPGTGARDPDYVKSRLRAARHRSARLQAEGTNLRTKIVETERTLAVRNAEIEGLATEYKLAQAASESSRTRLRDLEGIAGFRAERIGLLDPGFVPEKPSSPNVPLNVFFALTLAIMVALGYLTGEYALGSRPAAVLREVPRVAGRA
jgi:capsular polysaccharide biosynthesis protein